MRKSIVMGLALSALVCFSGCRGCGPKTPAAAEPLDGPAKVAAEFLTQQGIDPHSLRVMGSDAFITYEASQALSYNHELLVVWGTILGALAECAPGGVVTIVNTAGGQPAVLVKARSADIKAYTGGTIDFDTMMSRVQLTPAK